MPPGVDLEWEQGLFRVGRALVRRLRGADAVEATARGARLEDHRAALSAFAQTLSGVPVRIVAVRDAGGVRGRDLLLPATLAVADTPEANRALYVLRTALAATIVRLGLAERRSASDEALPAPLRELRVVEEACAWLANELPGFAVALARARASAGTGEALFAGRFEPCDPGREAAASHAGVPESDASGVESEADAPRVGSIERVALEPDARGDILWNPYERVETLDEYRGGSRNLDGADDLDAHLAALSEVDLGKLTRDGSPAQSLLRADISLAADAADVASRGSDASGIAYDEWNWRTRSYRADWCTVYPRRAQGADLRWAADASARHRRRIAELRRRLERHRAGRRSVDRQLDGEDVDLAALVDERAAAAAGFGGNPRLYVRQQQRRRDFATTVLLDISLSTDAWIRGKRVLDVARDAVYVLGEVAEQLGDRLRVLAFASETRNHCYVWEILGWDEPWQAGRARLGSLAPRGYTRIGPAIRHATADLAAVAAERKLLLLVSDAKPTDYDRYEGHYGIADVRQALREAEQRGLRAHALAVDVVARAWLPALFGPGAWHVLPHPERLPDVLTEVYGRLTLASG